MWRIVEVERVLRQRRFGVGVGASFSLSFSLGIDLGLDLEVEFFPCVGLCIGFKVIRCCRLLNNRLKHDRFIFDREIFYRAYQLYLKSLFAFFQLRFDRRELFKRSAQRWGVIRCTGFVSESGLVVYALRRIFRCRIRLDTFNLGSPRCLALSLIEPAIRLSRLLRRPSVTQVSR